jgi:hypothetical protein
VPWHCFPPSVVFLSAWLSPLQGAFSTVMAFPPSVHFSTVMAFPPSVHFSTGWKNQASLHLMLFPDASLIYIKEDASETFRS